jgi:hypothetical protein
MITAEAHCPRGSSACWQAQAAGFIAVADMLEEADRHAREGHDIQFTVTWPAEGTVRDG